MGGAGREEGRLMAFARPTLTQIIDRVTADIGSRVTGVDGAVLRRSLLGIIGQSTAGAAHHLYGYIDWVSRQVMPDTAEGEYLARWAAIWGVTRQPAGFASGVVTFTGTVGSTIPDGTIVQRQDGAQYATQGAVTLTASTASVPVQAVTAGAAGNLAAGVTVSLLSPVAGIQSNATSGSITGGADKESDEKLLARLLQRIQNPPHGGSAADYVQWALEVPDVTRAWVYPRQQGAGTVTVLFVVDNAGVIPTASKVTEVQSHIDGRGPVTAEVFVAAPIAQPLDMTIKLSPNTAAVQAAVRAELEDLLSRDGEPGKPILISRLREAVSIAAGEDNNQIVTPTADVTHATGYMPTLGTLTFQSF